MARMQLRDYQVEAVERVYSHIRDHDTNPCVVIPTGGGKTPVIATICRDVVDLWDGRVIVLAHVKELLQQSVEKLHMVAPDLWNKIGIYSAGLKSRDTDQPIIVAGIQSVYRRAEELGKFDIIICDEAHRIPESGEGQYRTFINAAKNLNPLVRVVGMTATPFRTKSGMICNPNNILNKICYEVGIKELINRGFLCKIRAKGPQDDLDTSALKIRAGEFVADQVDELMNTKELIEVTSDEIIKYTQDRKSVLIFAASVSHGKHLANELRNGQTNKVTEVFGDTTSDYRRVAIEGFRDKTIKYLVNCNVFTEGFDAPNVDCIAIVRPTASPGLYYQMCLDMETEVLTPGGWRHCHEVTIGDMVATFDLESEEITYAPALDKVHRMMRSHEFMYGVQSPHLDIRITNQHNLIVRCRSKSTKYWKIQPASIVAKRKDTYTIPIAGVGDIYSKSDAPITDAEVSFLGWFLSDGYYNKLNGQIVISQSIKKYPDEIRKILKACGFGFGEYRIQRTGSLAKYEDNIMFCVSRGQPRGINAEKRGWSSLHSWIDKDVPKIYNSLSARQFLLLLESMNQGNGKHLRGHSYKKKTMDICVGCRKRLADRIQQISIERGFRCNISELNQKSNMWNEHPQKQWIIHVRKQRIAYIGGTSNSLYSNDLVPNRCCISPVSHVQNEWVWCLTTEKGTLVTRRNGKIAIVGNCGRGFRIDEGKDDCLVLDFGRNVERHGPVDCIRPLEKSKNPKKGTPRARKCPECFALISPGYRTCPECGADIPRDEKIMDTVASEADILSGKPTIDEYAIAEVSYSEHTKRHGKPGDPKTLRVDYQIGWQRWISEWVCFEHTGWARMKAEKWWNERIPDPDLYPAPHSVSVVVSICENGGLREPSAIKIKWDPAEKYDRVVGYVFPPF